MQQEIVENLFNIQKLRELVSRVTCRELRQCITNSLTDGSPEPYALLHGLLTALQSHQEDADKDEKSLQICLAVVKTLSDESLTSRNAQDAVSTLASFVSSLRPVETEEIFRSVLTVLRCRVPKSAKLFELLPALVAHLDMLEIIPDDDEEEEEEESLDRTHRKVGKENRLKGMRNGKSAVGVLCRGHWCSDNTLAVASAFSDAALDAGERELLLRRLLASLPEQEITNLPALVHQMVLIGVKGDPRLALEGIFNFLIESDRQAAASTEAAGSDADIISEGPEPFALVQAEGTILLHFLFAAKQNQHVATSVLKGVKALLPEHCLEPSLLGLQLTLMGVPRMEEKFLEHAQLSIQAVLRVHATFRQSAWIRSLTSAPAAPLETVMRTVENCCAGQWDCVCPGLLRLALALLDSGQPKGGAFAAARASATATSVQFDQLSEQQIRLGGRILRLMFKRLTSARADILSALVRRLISQAQRPTARLYAGLVGDLVAQFPQSCLEHSRTLREPLDYLPLLPLPVASTYVHGLLPLLRADMQLRNQMMIVLRKALFLRQAEARAVGVSGLLSLLQHFRVIGALSTQASSCSSQEGNFVCSQVQVHLPLSAANPNDGLCTEVLGLLRRCLDQQSAEQRCAILRGLTDVLSRNKQLALPVLSVIKAHFDRCFDADEDVQPAFSMDYEDEACVTPEVVLQLSRALNLCSSSILSGGILNEAEPESAALATLCQDAAACLTSGLQRMTRLGADDVGVTNLTNASTSEIAERAPRSVRVAGTACDILDGLLEFELLREEKFISADAMRLFSRREFFKRLAKDNTGGAAKPKPRGRSSASSIPASSPQSKLPHGHPVLSLVSLQSALCRCFAAKWAEDGAGGDGGSVSDVQEVGVQGKFALHLLELAGTRVEAEGASENITEGKALALADLASECLRHYNGALTLLLETAEISDLPLGRDVMAQALKLATTILTLLMDKSDTLLESCIQRIDISRTEDSQMTISQLAKQMKAWCEELLENVSETTVQRDCGLLLPLLVRLCQHRVSDNLDWLAELADWLADRLRKPPPGRSGLDQTITRILLEHALLVARLAKPGHCLLRELACDLHCRLGDVDQNTSLDDSTTFATINNRNAGPLIPLLTSHIDKALDDCDWLLGQLTLAWPVFARKAGKNKKEALDSLDHQDRALCLRLGYLCNALDELVQSAVPPGNLSDAVVKCLTRLYQLLANLSRHYLQLVKESIGKFSPKFEKLVRLSGSYLSPHSYAFIANLQTLEIQKARETAETKEKKGKTEKDKAKKVPAVVGINLSRSKKDSRTLPNLIFMIEQFERFLILLGKRAGAKLMQHVKISTARDFRINQHALTEALAAERSATSEEEEEEEEEEGGGEGRGSGVAGVSRTEISFGQDSIRESQGSHR